MVPTVLTVITCSGKREWFERNADSIFPHRKGNQKFLFLFNTSVSTFEMESHNSNCANSSAQWKTDKLPEFLTTTIHHFLRVHKYKSLFPANTARNWALKYLDCLQILLQACCITF